MVSRVYFILIVVMKMYLGKEETHRVLVSAARMYSRLWWTLWNMGMGIDMGKGRRPLDHFIL